MQFQMLNRDTGAVVFQAEALGWRQFKIAYIQWAQTTQQGILSPELQEIRKSEDAIFFLTDAELRLIGTTLFAFGADKPIRDPDIKKLTAIYLKIKRHLDQT